jgi:voltage-gated potassium channel
MNTKETKITPTQATSRLWKFWDWLIVLVAVFRSVEVPAIVALKFFQSAPLLVLTINLTTSLLLLFDILLRFQRPVSTARGTLYGKQARLHYLKTYFFLDLIGSLPWSLIGNHLLPEGIWSEPISFLCLFRLARVVVFSQDFVRTPSRFFIARRLTVFLLWIALVIHLLACGWIAVDGVTHGLTAGHTYIRALYWSVTTVSTTGFGDITPKTEPQMIYTMLAMILGAGLYATVVANVASLISRSDSARAAFDSKIERLNTLMKYKNMPDSLQKQILGYHEYLWQTGLGHDHEDLLGDLSPGLRRSVGLFLNRHILEQIPMLRGAETAVLHRLISGLTSVVYTPGDTIIHHGEPGDTMYLINRGEVEVVDPKQGVVATLGEGEYFGELALLDPNRPRLADVRAKTFCALSLIDRETFSLVLEQFPDFATHVRKVAATRIAESELRAGRV